MSTKAFELVVQPRGRTPATPEALNSRYLEEREKWPKAKKAPSSPHPPPYAASRGQRHSCHCAYPSLLHWI